MPQKSIVIAPEKMVAFYSLHRVEGEINPYTGKYSLAHPWSPTTTH